MRNSFRLDVDDGDVIELAAWIRPALEPTTFHVRELGMPNLLLGRVNCSLRLDNLSADGLGVSLPVACRHYPKELQRQALLVYLKLANPLNSSEEPLSLLLGCTVRALRHTEERIYLGLHIVCEGVPDAGEKVVHLINVEKYGITDLTRWCDEKDRALRSGLRGMSTGLRMERLLSEIACALDDGTDDSGEACALPPKD